MGNQVKRENNHARLKRIIYSGWDFQQSLSALTFLMEEFDSEDEYSYVELRKLKCYETSAIISFCRPFEASRNKSTLSLKEIGVKLTAEEKQLKNKLMFLRKKIIAHSDEDEMHFRVSTFEVNIPNGKMNIPHAQFDEWIKLPEEDFLCFADLISKLIHAVSLYKLEKAKDNPELLNSYHPPKTLINNQKALNVFYKLIKEDTGDSVFNPWRDHDPKNDFDAISPEIRLYNLKKYLKERTNAEYLLLAEAMGYQGGHFTGIPMTSERIILGNKSDIGISSSHVCNSTLRRTSNQKRHENGFNEPTATIVWQKLITETLDTRNYVFWNAFAWHPYKRNGGLLTNRTPGASEMREGEIVLKALIDAFKFKKIIALGNKAHNTLIQLQIDAVKVRHPAMGGAKLFREQFLRIIKQ